MAKKPNAFTILELLIAISISGFIVTGMIQAVRSAQKTLTRSRMLLQSNKSACLFFNQIERDFNTAFVPIAETPEEKTDKTEKEDEKKEEKPAKKKPTKKKKKKEKEKISFFSGEADEEESKKMDDKRYHPFTKTSFINTNPLQVWGQRKVRLVRVGYELIQNKKQSTRKHISYDLFRKETTDLKNQKFKEPDETDEKKKPPIRKHLVASNIKEMYIEYQMPKPKSKKEKFKTTEEEEQLLQTFVWGKTKETKNIVPQQVHVRVTFWGDETDDKPRMENTYSCVIPIFSYPTIKKKKKVKKDEKKKKDEKEGKKKEEKKAPKIPRRR